MKQVILILIILFSIINNIFSQTKSDFDLLIEKGDKAFSEGDYFSALDLYDISNNLEITELQKQVIEQKKLITKNAAKQQFIELKLQKNKSDSLIKIANEALIKTETALAKAEEMQINMETAIFEKIVKNNYPDWNGLDFSIIQNLDFSNNVLNRIPKEVLFCENLETLNLFGNNIQDWNLVFSELSKLHNLNNISISINTIDEIPKEFWNKIVGINLLLSDLKDIPFSIVNFKRLKYFEIITQNNFENNIDLICNLNDLEYLKLENCNISKLSSEIGNLTKLKYLFLSNNQIIDIPKEIGKLTELIEIDFSNNKISEIPIEFSKLKKLETLNLFSNKLNDLPLELTSLTNLKYLTITENPIFYLPSEFENLFKNFYDNYIDFYDNDLRYFNYTSYINTTNYQLDLSNNQLIKITKNIGIFTQLYEIDLHNNFLDKLPAEIKNLKEIIGIDLSFNNFIDLQPEIFEMENIKLLFLNNNKIKILPKEIKNLKDLKELDLSNNQLNELPLEIFDLKNLYYLNLENNKISKIDNQIKNLQNLKYLILKNTNISEQSILELKTLLPNCIIEF